MLSFARPPRNYVAEGDSITATGLPSGYNGATSSLANPRVDVYTNKAVGGSSVATMQSRAAAVDALYVPGATNILSVLIGANDLAVESTSSFLTDLASYTDARRAVGWYVIICTVLPQSNSTFITNRAVVNPELRLWTTNGSIISGKHCDRIADFAADPVMGPDGNASDTTYFSDGIHPTLTGQARLRDIFWPVFDASLSGVRLNPTINTSAYSCDTGSADLVLNLRADRGVTWSISGGNAGGALNLGELFQLKLTASTLGTYSTTLTATDGNGLATSISFSWTVANPPSGYGPSLLLNGTSINGLLGWLGSGSEDLTFSEGPPTSSVDNGSGSREFRINGTPFQGIQQNLTTINGKTYKIDGTYRVGSATSAVVGIPSGNFPTSNTTNTAFSQSFVSSGTAVNISAFITGTGDAFFSNIALRQLLP